MRIIAGLRRGHNLEGPPDRSVRPTSDRVRESLFAILRDQVEGRPVFDLFAGTGALGLEALSRGAASATFIEHDRRMVGLIRRNARHLRFESQAAVQMADAFRWVAKKFPVLDHPAVVLIDPPYRLYEQEPARVTQMLRTIIERVPEGSILVVEASKHVPPDLFPDRPRWDARRYGDTELVIYERPADPPVTAAPVDGDPAGNDPPRME